MSKTHDYTSPTWGHAVYVISVDGDQARVIGFGHGVSKGDMLLLPNGAGTTRYRVKTVRYGRPSDCWTADAEFSPREGTALEGGPRCCAELR